MKRYTRHWNEEKLLSILAYRPFITVSHFSHADKAKRRCVFAAKKRGLVVLENGLDYFTVRLARQPENAYTQRKYSRYGFQAT